MAQDRDEQVAQGVALVLLAIPPILCDLALVLALIPLLLSMLALVQQVRALVLCTPTTLLCMAALVLSMLALVLHLRPLVLLLLAFGLHPTSGAQALLAGILARRSTAWSGRTSAVAASRARAGHA